MKKVLFGLMIGIFMIFPIGVLAEGGFSVSPNYISVNVGGTATFSISSYNTIGDVTISSNNPGVATVDRSWWETGMVGEKENKNSGNIIVTGVSEGSTTITINVDGATFDNETLSSPLYITVNVTPQQNNNNNNNGGGNNPTPSVIVPRPNGNNNNNNNTSNNDNNNQEEKKEEKKSDNSKIKTLTVDNYSLKKINDNKYELTVANKVNMVNIKAVAADSKATVKGNGVHELTVGENKIEVTITAEDGSKNTITILVTREEENVEVEPTNTVETTDTEPENKINIISIIMIGLNIVLAIAVISLFIKNKKLKESLVSNK